MEMEEEERKKQKKANHHSTSLVSHSSSRKQILVNTIKNWKYTRRNKEKKQYTK